MCVCVRVFVCVCVAVNSHAFYRWIVNDITDCNSCFLFQCVFLFWSCVCQMVCVCVRLCVYIVRKDWNSG